MRLSVTTSAEYAMLEKARLGIRGTELVLVTVIGRGHGGTRAISHTLSESGVYMGAELNKSGDLIPPDDMY